jgi:hypothetical protein
MEVCLRCRLGYKMLQPNGFQPYSGAVVVANCFYSGYWLHIATAEY